MAAVHTVRQMMALPAHLRGLAIKYAVIMSTFTSARSPASSTPSTPPSRAYATYNTNASAASAASAASTASTSSPVSQRPSYNSSVNDAEVSHFTTLASSWWDPHGSSRLLHLMNPLRHDFIKQCLGPSYPLLSSRQRLDFLDIGCGGGIFAESAARLRLSNKVIGIDPTPMCIQVARAHARSDPMLVGSLNGEGRGKLEYRNIAIEDLELPAKDEEKFHVVTLFEVIEHIRDPAPFLEMALNHVKPGGWLIGSTIARTGTSWLTTKLMAEEVLRLVPRGTHEWTQYINPGELREWARACPHADVEVAGDGWRQMGVVYVPAVGWKVVQGSEDWGNYFWGIRKVGRKEED